MSLSSARSAFVSTVTSMASTGATSGVSAAAAAGNLADAIIALVQAATVTVPGTGLSVTSAPGAVTGTSTGGSLS